MVRAKSTSNRYLSRMYQKVSGPGALQRGQAGVCPSAARVIAVQSARIEKRERGGPIPTLLPKERGRKQGQLPTGCCSAYRYLFALAAAVFAATMLAAAVLAASTFAAAMLAAAVFAAAGAATGEMAGGNAIFELFHLKPTHSCLLEVCEKRQKNQADAPP